MPREKEGNREVFAELFAKYGKLEISKREACQLLGISARTMAHLTSSGRLVANHKSVNLWQIARYIVS